MQIDDSGNLTGEALVQTNNNAPTNLNVKEVNTGFTWDMDKTLSDGMVVGNDVAVSRLVYHPNDYWHMGMRFVELADADTETRTAEEDCIYGNISYDGDKTTGIVGCLSNPIKDYIGKLETALTILSDKNANTVENPDSFTFDNTVVKIYEYKKDGDHRGNIIWSLNAVDGLEKISDSSAEGNRITGKLTDETRDNLGYTNLDYCFSTTDDKNATKTINIPEYIVVEDKEGKLTKRKVVGITSNAMLLWNKTTGDKNDNYTSYVVNIPESVKRIGQRAFHPCKGDVITKNFHIKEINIGSVHAIAENAFFDSKFLTDLNIISDGEGSSIGNNAFQNCGQSTDNGTNVTIQNIASIGNQAFYQSKLSGVTINMAGAGTIGSNAFNPDNNDTRKKAMKTLTIEGVGNIGESAFKDNTGLTSIDIIGNGDNSSIGNTAFQYCGLSSDGISLEINNISQIGQSAFNEAKLTSVTINMVGDGKIDSYAFKMSNNNNDRRMFSMGVLKITGVKTIGTQAFNNNKGLTLVEITGSDDGVSIGSEAFGWSGYQSQPNTKSEAIITNVSQIYNGGFSNTKFTTLDFSTVNNGNFNDNAITINNETKYLKTIIFGDGTLTMTNNSMNTNLETIKLIIFQNTNPTQLVSIPSNNLKDKGYYVVFTGLTEDEVPTSIKTSLSGNTIYYKGDEDLTETVITAIETAVGTTYMNDKARNLLRVIAGLPALTMSTRPRLPVSSQSNAKPQVSTNLAFLTLEQRKFLGLEE